MAAKITRQYSEDTNYSSRDTSVSIAEFIQQADSLWNKYRTEGHDEVEVVYANDIMIQMNFDSTGRGKKLIEFYKDTVAHQLQFFTLDSSYSYTQYNSFYGFSLYMEQWLPKEGTMEYWHYNAEEVLVKLIKITTLKTRKIEKETTYLNFKGTTRERYYNLKDNDWIFEKEIIVVEP